jgi:hypothetical protein
MQATFSAHLTFLDLFFLISGEELKAWGSLYSAIQPHVTPNVLSSLCSHINARAPVSHVYKSIGNIMFFFLVLRSVSEGTL